MRKRHLSRRLLPQGRGQTGPKMAASRYRRFLKLCEEWPVDETKRGRDLGSYLRQRVAQAFREGENTQVTGLWGPPAAGWRLGRGAERTRHGWGPRAGEQWGPRMRKPSLPGRTCARTLLYPHPSRHFRERRPRLLFSALWLHFGITEETF